MKRMTLVEKAMLERLREKKVTEQLANPEMTSMIEIQHQIEGLLNNSKLSDEEKVILLDRARERFAKLMDSLRPTPLPPLDLPPIITPPPPPTLPPIPPTATPFVIPPAPPLPPPRGTSTGVGPAAPSMYESVQLPSQYDAKFGKLKEFLNAVPKLIGKNAYNELILEGKRIPNSNFDDLMRNLYVPRESYNLTGVNELVSTLKRLNLPHNYLSNKDLAEQLAPPSSAQPPPKVSGSVEAPVQKGKGYPPGKRPRILLLYR